MNNEALRSFYSWFNNYVKNFYSGDPNTHFHVRLKEQHTARVCKNILSIGKSIGLDENRLFIAETIALFHDIGRFGQFLKYRTFSDSKSEDHARLGVNILKELKVLDCLPELEKDIILKAVGYHNVCCLPADEDPECLLFSKLIRDADKLDILDILMKYYEKPEQYPYLKVGEAMGARGYSENVVSDILSSRNIKYTDVKTSDDMKLLRLSWVFDINFGFTLLQIKKKGFVDEIVRALPYGTDTVKIHNHIAAYIESRL